MVSAIEKQLSAATGIKIKASGAARQKSLVAIVAKVRDKFTDDEWDSLSEPAQAWVNAGTQAQKDNEPVKDFDDEDAVADDEPADDDAETEPSDDEPEEDPEVDDDEDDTDAEPDERTDDESTDPDDEEDEDVTAKKTKGKKVAAKKATPSKKVASKKVAAKKATPEKTKQEDKKKVTAKKAAPEKTKVKPKAEAKADKPNGGVAIPINKTDIKYRLKRIMMKDPNISAESLFEKLNGGSGEGPTQMTVTQIRAEFRHSLRFLKMEGHLETAIN